MIAIASRAAAARAAEGRAPFQYAVVLTKTDKAGEKQLRTTEQEVRAGLAANDNDGTDGAVAAAAAADVAVLRTSSVARVGRDDVWKLLQGVLHRRQAHTTDDDEDSSSSVA
jgi:GTPase